MSSGDQNKRAQPSGGLKIAETNSSSDPRTIHTRCRHRLPSIISGLYKRYSDVPESDISQKYAHGLTLTEGVFRFFSYVNIANVIAIEGASDEILKHLRSLSAASIGTFCAVNRWAYSRLRLSSTHAFCPELMTLFKSNFWAKLQNDIPQFRNQYGHGTLIVVDEAKYRELKPYLEELIERIQWLSTYRLGSFTDGNTRRRSKSSKGYWRLSAGLEEDAEPILIETSGEPPPWDEVVLLNPSCDRLLSLSPLLHRVNSKGIVQYYWFEKIPKRKDLFIYRHPHLTELKIESRPRLDQEFITPADYEKRYADFHCIVDLSLSPRAISLIQSPHNLGDLEQGYEILRKIGEGGMSVVYEVHNRKLNARSALKVLKNEFRYRNVDIARFNQEAQLLRKLRHPSIIDVFHIDQIGDAHFIEMEFIEGQSLKDYLSKQSLPEMTVVVDWLTQILEALQYIHESGIIHRDLKPSNIMISGDQIKIIDFGIAKAEGQHFTRTGTLSILGTELFMAPEQWENQATLLSDLYSCGLLLGTLLGHPPRVPNRPSDLPKSPSIPPHLKAAYEKATSQALDHRFQSADEFLDAIQPSNVNSDLSVVRTPLTSELRIADTPLAICSIETTGRSRSRGSEIIEISVIRLEPGQTPKMVFDSIIKPIGSVDMTEVHQISAQDVTDAPTFIEASLTLREALSGAIWVGYNASVGLDFLRHAFCECLEIKVDPPYICARLISELLGLGRGRQLSRTCVQFGIDLPDLPVYLAARDAWMTMRLMRVWLDRMTQMGLTFYGELGTLGSLKFLESFKHPLWFDSGISEPQMHHHPTKSRYAMTLGQPQDTRADFLPLSELIQITGDHAEGHTETRVEESIAEGNIEPQQHLTNPKAHISTIELELVGRRRIPFTLWSGDLCDLTPDSPYDVLLLSGKYSKRYGENSAFYPSKSSVLGVLKNTFGLDLTRLPYEHDFKYYADKPIDGMDDVSFDAQRHTLCLLSKPLVSSTHRTLPFSRILIVVPPQSYAHKNYASVHICIDHVFNALSLWYQAQQESERTPLKVLSTMLSLGRTQSQRAHLETLETMIRNGCDHATLSLASLDLITYFSEQGSPFRLKQDHEAFYETHFRTTINEHQKRLRP